ncbi:T9SS type A sorting domain-containing protein [Chryseobacterium sp. SN22]|uniref:T9SS type A sorting domain-containing protein n=1 Tax=Chryseobacterium sp. SN22 TaxID=2606431 RepID=UPI0011EF1052|nr:T9SS type A sorting domain-containing protein [Chryseobacterium sp. SN22]KAA0129275.1 T9SS type A sorting domain-containing protein [Chryseobacterium sp. SN22]
MKKFYIISSLFFIINLSAQNFTQTSKLTPVIRQGGDSFGFDLLLKNNFLYSSLHGNYYDSNDQNSLFKAGSFYVFEWQNNSWVKKTKLVASDRSSSDEFGKAFALGDDNKLFIGAAEKRSGTSFAVGAVYFFSKNNNGDWIQVQKLMPAVAAAYTHFGYRLGADSNTLAVGTEGKGFTIYEYNSSSQMFDFKQNFPSIYNSNPYVYNNRIFIGSSNQVVNGTSDTGQVTIYKKNISSNTWELNQTINSPVTGSNQFGFTTHANGDYLFITAANSINRFVAVYKLEQATGQYNYVQTINNGATYFGSRISIDNNLLAINAPGATNEITNGGAVFLYRLENNIWVQKQKIFNNDSHPYDGFGYGLSVNNNNVVVGAPDHDFDSAGNNISTSAGAVYFFNDLSNLATQESEVVYSYKIYPNPFIKNISILLDKKYEILTAEVYDSSGKKVYAEYFSERQELDMNLESLIPGVYQIRVISKNKQILSSRIVKKQ